MSLLKAQLRRPNYITNSDSIFYENPRGASEQNKNIALNKTKSEDIRVKYEPGVILKISFANPIESDKIFKVQYLY